uniref:EF-hand domain pair protein n=1 Tax=Marseillevirus LCMAC101 TaxID=2506602 RepID=A0A481YST3_9VIRU|nr:MAG: EF-hand domain pair protein [Marseillevirus LCMAC101]
MSTLDEDEITILQAVFNKYDVSNTGYLSIDEFVRLLLGLSKHVRELKEIEMKKASAVFTYLDKDVDGKLSFTEFETWWNKQNKYDIFCGEKALLLRKAYQLFSNYTKDSETSLSNSGFNEMMKELGLPTCDEMCFDDLDLDNDGKLSFEEFCDWLHWF